ncbi:MAG: hypothetical protein AAF721_13740 [Myxococcota bacterium]
MRLRSATALLLVSGCNLLLGIDSSVEILCETGADCESGFCRADNTCDARQWARALSGPGDDHATDLAFVPQDGDLEAFTVVVGSFEETLDVGPVDGEAMVLQSEGGADAFVVALDRAGETLWARALGGAGEQAARSLVVDDTGAIYVAGALNGLAEFGGQDIESPSGGRAAFVVKLSREGDLEWARGFGGGEWVEVADMVLANGDQPSTVGTTKGLWPGGENNPAVDPQFTYGFIASYAPNGGGGQVLQLPAMMADGAACFALEDGLTGELLVAGNVSGQDADGNLVEVGYLVEFFIGASGATESEVTDLMVPLSAITTDSLARLTLGWASDTLLPVPGVAVQRQVGMGSEVVRASIDPANVDLTGLATNSANETVAFGRFRGSMAFEPSPTLEGDGWDLFAVTIDETFALDVDRAHAFAATGDAVPGGLAVDADDRVLLSGGFAKSLELTNAQGTRTLESTGGRDAFVTQLEL